MEKQSKPETITRNSLSKSLEHRLNHMVVVSAGKHPDMQIHSCGIRNGIEKIKEAVGDKKGIRRYGSCILPMDETLVLCAVDLSGRPYLVFDGEFTTDRVGYMDTDIWWLFPPESTLICRFIPAV